MLSKRQREVVELLMEGWTRAEIAEKLGIGEQTVKTHVMVAAEKLGARNAPHIVALYKDHEMAVERADLALRERAVYERGKRDGKLIAARAGSVRVRA